MRDLIVFGSVAVVLGQDPEIVYNSQILVDDVLLGGAGVFGRDDVQLLRTLSHLEHELK